MVGKSNTLLVVYIYTTSNVLDLPTNTFNTFNAYKLQG